MMRLAQFFSSIFAFCMFFILCAFAPQAAFGLDCAKPEGSQDKILCADPKAKAADAAMTAAYEALMDASPGEKKDALLQSQIKWLKSRENICGAANPAALAACLISQTDARRFYLEGRPETGPGVGAKLIPLIIEHEGAGGEYDINVTLLKFANPNLPGEKLFNDAVDKLVSKIPHVETGDPREDVIYSYIVAMRLSYASPKLISAHVETYDYSGGAHGDSTTSNINIDMARDRILRFSDVFQDGAGAKFGAACLQQIEAQKKEKLPGQKFDEETQLNWRQAIKEGLGNLQLWRFSANEAEVSFDPYALGAYVEGSYHCRFAPDFLRPLAKPDSVAPPRVR